MEFNTKFEKINFLKSSPAELDKYLDENKFSKV